MEWSPADAAFALIRSPALHSDLGPLPHQLPTQPTALEPQTGSPCGALSWASPGLGSIWVISLLSSTSSKNGQKQQEPSLSKCTLSRWKHHLGSECEWTPSAMCSWEGSRTRQLMSLNAFVLKLR